MSWAHIRPKGSRRNLYLPWGELKVVYKELAWSSLMFQYPLWAWTMLKYLASLNFGSTSSNVGVQWCGCLMARFRSFGSKHGQSVRLALVTQTNEFTQSVGSSTFAMMPCLISASSSLLRGARSASGTHHGGWMTGGTVGSRVMWNSPWKHPIPWKQSWYWQRSSDFASALPCGSGIGTVSVCVVEIPWLRVTSFISRQVGRPRIVGPTVFTTWNAYDLEWPWCDKVSSQMP